MDRPFISRRRSRDALKHDVLALFLLLGAALASDCRAVLFGEIPRYEDVVEQHEPFRWYYVRQLRAGRVPLWDPYLGLGVPILAESITGVFYPLNLLVYSLLPFREGVPVLWVIRCFLAGAFAYACGRGFGLRWKAALLGALVFVLNGFVVAHRWVLMDRWGWVEAPLVLLAAERLATRPRLGTVLWAGLAFAVFLLNGHFHLQWITLVLYLVYGAVRAAGASPRRRRLSRAVLLLAPLVLGLALAAVQVIPSAELKPLSPRAAAGEYQREGGVPPPHLISYVFPYLFRDADAYWEPLFTSLTDTLCYVGLVPLALAGLAWRRRRDVRPVPALLAAAGVLTLLSFGKWLPGYQALMRLPGFGYFGNPGRYVFGVALCLGLLAGVGLEVVAGLSREALQRWLRRLALALAALALAAAVVGVAERAWVVATYSLVEALVDAGTVLGRLGWSLPAVVASALALWALSRRWRWAEAALLAVAAADMLLLGYVFAGPAIAPSRPPRVLAQPGPVLNRLGPPTTDLRHAGGPHSGRVLAGHRALYFTAPYTPRRAHWVHSLNPGVRLPDGRSRTYADVAHLLRAFHVGFVLSHEEIEDARLELMLAGPDEQIDRLHGPRARTWYLYRCRSVLPRAYLVDQAIWCPDQESAQARAEAPDWDPGRQVILEDSPPMEPAPASAAVHGPPGDCALEVDEEERVVLRVSARRPAWLVLSDLYYPGWQASLCPRGEPMRIYPANGAARAVRVPAGECTIEFAYRPPSVRWGVAISLASAGLVAALATILLVRGRGGTCRQRE